ncbi:NirA family protein [Roseibium aggregatum]|uniref:NirA family protein n=1 Tax=Roseibium aggregatum TaxID=187304 RepID=A0A939EB45_9HYPH|nr:NirA family protein [Roseibium aggregatum]MBN9669259.1 NirA family protein [Roseibium aggregatum]
MHAPIEKRGFSEEQLAYLANAVAKLGLHKAFQPDAGPAAEAENVYGTPLEELCKEEVAKYNLHPLDLRARIERWTDRNEIATGLDQFLLRHWGFFNVEPNSQGYMVRLRLPACKLRGDQMLALADIAQDYAGGYAHVTTRGNFQLREIEPKDVLNVMYDLQQAGLSCHGSGADSARNMTASPTSGFDPLELIDLSPYTIRLSNLVLHTRELQGLPRKFNISFDGGGSISTVSDSNDICFQAVEIKNNDQGLEPGIYCRIMLGGISGHRDLARDTGFVCTPEQTVLAGSAMLHVFVEHADRTNRKKARLKYLLDSKGFEWFVERTQEKLEELEAGFRLTPLSSVHDGLRPPVLRQAHIGVHRQSAADRNYVGVALEMGRLSPEQMRLIGRLALEKGSNDVRLTVWQNVLIAGIENHDIAEVVKALEENAMPTSATAFAAGAVACTGRWGCKLGLAYTKQNGTELVRHLEKTFTLDRPINIHLTGCPNSCAQHYIGDIGLVGTTLPDGGEGYHVVVGGGSDHDYGIARPLCGPVPADDVNEVVETIVGNYLSAREPGASFLEFVRSLDDSDLSRLLHGHSLAA